MGLSVFPAASTSSVNASTIVCSQANTMYGANTTFAPGVYTITCASGIQADIFFHSSTDSIILKTYTVNGTITVNLATPASRVAVFTNSGTDTAVTIALTANAITNNISGTLDTITSSGTYIGTSPSGFGYAVLYGAGAGSAGGNGGYHYAGGNGGCAEKIVALTGSMAVTIGSGGTYGGNGIGTAGGASTFAGMTANGGEPGRYNDWSTPINGGTATGGTYNTQGYGGGPTYWGDMSGRVGSATPCVFKPVGTIPVTWNTSYGMKPLYNVCGFVDNGSYPARPGVLFILRF